MTRTTVIIAAFAMLAAACGAPAANDGTTAADPAASAPAATSTNTAPSTTSTTGATTTTAPAPTTTTEAPTTATTTTATTTAAPQSDELAALQGAFERSAAVISGRMEGSMEISGLDPAQGLTEMVIPFGGAFDNASGNFSFYMDMSGLAEAAGDEIPPEFAGLFDKMEMRQIGDTAYLKFAFFNMFLGAETPWISMPAEEGADATDGFVNAAPGNPSEILGSFEDVGATVEVVGTETVNGVQATHYRAVFDTEALLAAATPEERAQLEAQGPLPTDVLPIDVWVSEDGLVVRFIMEIDGSAIEGPPEESFGRMVIRYDLLDLGGDVTIEPPPADDVTDIEDLEGSFGFDI